MTELKKTWEKPLWQRNAEDNMSLQKEIEKNYDALTNLQQQKALEQNNVKQLNNSTPQSFAKMAEKNKNHDYLFYFERDKDKLCENEGGMIPYAYLDTAKKPNTTIGCGINIEQTPNINLYHAQTKEPLSSNELSQEISNLKSAYKNNGKHTIYEDKSNIRIAPEENERIMKNKYEDAYHYVISQYPDFQKYDQEQQRALMDMAYALGIPRFSKYQKMREAILNNDWEKAAEESWRYGSDVDRNIKTAVGLYPMIDQAELKKRYEK
ncbi:MAG: hypothetical protein J5896_01890 [Alphaproteobacteria bacterium]|nr:hypothetical protein [Alphaproteobacteria bacterium]